MKNRSIISSPFRLSITFLWIGFVGAISFMEAWLKFQAPGVTLPLGLGIGRLVFGALNKVEIIFALCILLSTIVDKQLKNKQFAIVSIPLVILFLQSIWLLPILDSRADLFIQNTPPEPSYLHMLYIIFEVVKVTCLFLYGASQFKKINRH